MYQVDRGVDISMDTHFRFPHIQLNSLAHIQSLLTHVTSERRWGTPTEVSAVMVAHRLQYAAVTTVTDLSIP